MTRLSTGPVNPYFTEDQIECLLNFAAQTVGSLSAVRGIEYYILGIEDLAKKEEAAALLRSLQAQDWDGAARHVELAGINNLLVAILLRIDSKEHGLRNYWVAMRSPFEYLDAASLITWGEVTVPPAVPMQTLPLETAHHRKR
jgi:hypothetical protein